VTDLRKLTEQATLIQKTLLARMHDDPLANFKAHPKQQIFIDSILKGKTKQAWAFCGNRSGKTQAAAFIGSNLARYGMPRKETAPHFIKDSGGTTIEVNDYATSGWVISQDFNASRDAVQPKYFDNGFVPPGAPPPFIPEREIKDMPEGWNIQN